MQEFVEHHGQNCYIPTSDHCSIKCNKYFTNKDYTEKFSTFIRTEKYRSGEMTSARFQPFCRKYNINIGCINGKEINSRNITERNTSLFIYNNHFCSNWKSNGISLNKAIEDELKPNFEVVDNFISD